MHKIKSETFSSGITTTAKYDSSSSKKLVVREPVPAGVRLFYLQTLGG